MKRGDIVLAVVPYLTGGASKRRPVLVVQADHLRPRVTHTIVAAITSNLSRAAYPECYLVDANHPDWSASGLRLESVVRCDRLFTLELTAVDRTLRSLSDPTMRRIDDCLKAALDLP